MRKLKWFVFSVLAAMVLIVAGCGSEDKVAEEEDGDQGATEETTYEWKLGWNSGVDDDTKGEAAKAFKQYVEEHSNGRITIEFFPNESYATSPEMIDAVEIGALEMAMPGANELANIIPEYAALSLPFLTNGFDEVHAVLDGPVGDHLKDLSKETRFVTLNDVELGFAQITNSVRPINVPDDLKGVKMRSPNDVSLIETFKAFGASVSTMAYTEIYSGLSQGVIDGQFNPLLNIFEQNMHEVQDYLAMTNHTYYLSYLILNKDVFDGLDPELQEIVMEGSERAKEAARAVIQKDEEEYIERAKAEFKEVTYPDSEKFQKAVQPVYKKVEDVMGAQIIEDMQKFLEEYRK